jgi:hypothetical protein
MNITIIIPDNKKDAIIEAFASQYKYPSKIEDEGGKKIDNPVSKGEFALSIIKSFIKDVYVANKVDEFTVQRSDVSEAAKNYAEEITIT